ncbi:SPOR domain-containing protein, partial [bacterium]|nr:SPOR domain-containing protein [bacterium]
MFKYTKYLNSKRQYISIYLRILFVITFFLFIFSITNSSSFAQGTFGTLKNSENFRINITTAQSFHNAKKISEKLNEIFNKAVYIQKENGNWRIQIGDINTFEEAKEIQDKLKSIGIKNVVIIKITGSPTEATEADLPLTNALLSKTDLFVTEINSDINVDGTLSEPAWNLNNSAFSGYFYQQEPFERQPSTEKTEVRILSDAKNLYFYISCFHKNPNTIFAKQMRRDSYLYNEDNIELFLDTYHDGRNCYYFSTNPLGAMVDAIVTDEGNFVNRDWDTVWYCKTVINDRGWTAEIKIPFTSLQFKEGEIYDWGINIGREISYNNESTFLVPIPRSLSHRGKYRPTLFAHLKNVQSPRNGKHLQIMPYVSGGSISEYRPNTNESLLNSGVDVSYNITPNLAADFTYKTDFAQVEADQEVVNFTRFNINLPEKREFFLQGAGHFSFGGERASFRESPDYMLFNSRSIGIYDEEKISLVGGAKLSGRIGKYSLGFLNIQTEKKAIDDSYTEPETNYTAFKLKRDILKNSNIGVMLLNKQNSEGYYDRAVGIDSYLSFNNEYTLSGSIANNIKPDIKSKNWAGTFRASLNKGWVDAYVKYVHLDTLFSPDMGFVKRDNIRSSSGKLGFTKWLN